MQAITSIVSHQIKLFVNQRDVKNIGIDYLFVSLAVCVKMFKKTTIIVLGLTMLLAMSSCKRWDNFTTYFNTYYNADKMMKVAEEEFEFQDEKKRLMPRNLVPQPDYAALDLNQTGTPAFMNEFIVTKMKRQPVQVKLDSILIKGSKILANHPKSEYIEKTLYLMAKTYFYKEEWLPSQIKCSELIDKYPEGDLSPDAHLLLSLNLLVQRKFFAGKTMLSRTVDMAWQKNRYDILSEAFRLEAEIALLENDLDGALKPYLQAVAQSDNNEQKARWQTDMASLLYRIKRFDKAEAAFAQALEFSPDYLTEFEAKLYRAASLIRLERHWEAEKILKKLENDGKFEEWQSYAKVQRMNIPRIAGDTVQMSYYEKLGDSLYNTSPMYIIYNFERGGDEFHRGDYLSARKYFAKARNLRINVQGAADRMYYLLNSWDNYNNQAQSFLGNVKYNEAMPEQAYISGCLALFEVGRIEEQFGKTDTARYYYQRAAELSPDGKEESARFIYAYSRSLKEIDPKKADSLLDVIVAKYPRTEYGKDAMLQLGYTNAFVRDSVADLFNSGFDLMKFGEYPFAVKQFSKLYITYPKSNYAPRSIYNIGWIYEKNIRNIDSAVFYYKLLRELYPESEYAKDVTLGVDFKMALDSGSPIPDSLTYKPKSTYSTKSDAKANIEKLEQMKQLQEQRAKDNKNKNNNQLQIDDLFKPKNLMEKAGNAVMKPLNDVKMPDINSLKDMKEIQEMQKLMSPEDSTSKPVLVPEEEKNK